MGPAVALASCTAKVAAKSGTMARFCEKIPKSGRAFRRKEPVRGRRVKASSTRLATRTAAAARIMAVATKDSLALERSVITPPKRGPTELPRKTAIWSRPSR
jgi:hypothetical protein